jgi:hypothetical protein
MLFEQRPNSRPENSEDNRNPFHPLLESHGGTLNQMEIRSSVATLNLLRTAYDIASIVQLSARVDGVWSNVCTTVIRGNRTLRRTLGQPRSNEVRVHDRLFAMTWADVDMTQADEFIASASAGAATVPNTNTTVTYSLAEPNLGFWGRSAPPTFQGTPLQRCCWAHSFPAASDLAGFELQATSSTARVADQLPERYPFPFGIADVRLQLDRIGSFMDIYPSYPEMRWRQTPSGDATVEVAVPAGLTLPFAEYRIDAELVNRGKRFASLTLPLAAGVRHEFHSTTEIDGFSARLYADDILVSETDAYFIKQFRINMSVITNTIVIPIDRTGTALAIGQSMPASIGAQTPGPDRGGIANAWAKSEGDRASYRDVLFVPGQTTPLDAYSWIAMLVRDAAAHESSTVARLIDPYAIDEACLRPIATIAAASSQKRIAILSESIDPQTRRPDPQFTAALQRLATELGVTIELHAPQISLHDRFITVGDRIWHVGHSFNALGRDLSAIIEIRDLRLVAQVHEVLGPEFARSPQVFKP